MGRCRLHHNGAPVAPVAGDIAATVREMQDRPAAVVGAVGAEYTALPGVLEVFHRVKADEGGAAAVGVAVGLHLLLHRESRTQSAHLAGIGGQGHVPAQILLQGPQDGEVPEGAPLDHYPIPQLRHVGDADHLCKHVLDDGAAQPRHQVVRLLAVALLVDDGAVHEHSAPAAQLGRGLRSEGGVRHLVHRHPQGGGEVLQKGAAAGGAGLVQHDVRDHAALQPDGLHVLAADVQQKRGVREEAAAAPGVGHGLYRVVVGVKGRREHLLAVAGGAQAQHFQLDAHFFIFLRQGQQALPDHLQRLPLVVGVESVRHLLVLVYKDALGGGGAGVDADVPPQNLPVRGIHRPAQLRPVAAEKDLPLLVAGKEGPAGAGGPFGLGRGLVQPLHGLCQGHGVLLSGEQLVDGDGGAPGHDGLRVVRSNDIPFLQIQPLRKHPHQRGVKGQRASLKDDGGRQLQSLGQAADGLLGDGVEGGKRDIRPLRPLDQQGLDVCLGKHAAAAGDAVNGLPAGSQLLELVRRHVQQRGDLIDKRAGASGAAAVHPHVGGLELSTGLVIAEEDHLGILSAQFHRGADLRIQGPDCRRVGHHLLDIAGPQGGGNGPSAGPAHADTEPHAGKVTGRLLQQLPDGIRLMGVMPLIAGEQYAVVSRVQGHCLDGGGPHIHAEAQNIRIDMCHIHSF